MPNIHHTCLAVADPERSTAFYGALGFRFDLVVGVVYDDQGRMREAGADEIPVVNNYHFNSGGDGARLELTRGYPCRR